MSNTNRNFSENISNENLVNYFLKNFFLSFDSSPSEVEKIKALLNKNNSSLSLKSIHNLCKNPSPLFIEWKGVSVPVFIYDNTQDLIKDNQPNFDIVLNSFLFLSGSQEIVADEKDKHGRFIYEDSLQHKFNFTKVPVVSIYFEIFYETLRQKEINITKKTFDSSIVFTHDIDQLRSGWFENIGYEKSNFSVKSLVEIPKNIIIKIFNLKDPYFKAFENMMQIEKKHNIKSLSFIMSKKSHKDADYDFKKKDYTYLLKKYKNQGHKLGFHPGYNTHDNNTEYRVQKELLENQFNIQLKDNRQHFLKFDVSKTPEIHKDNEIEKDYTLGFAEQYGFRNSICSPFYLYDFKNNTPYSTLQIPLFLMDSTLIDYLNSDAAKETDAILETIEGIIKKYTCHFSVLFHNTAFSKKRYKGFTELYEKIIKVANE